VKKHSKVGIFVLAAVAMASGCSTETGETSASNSAQSTPDDRIIATLKLADYDRDMPVISARGYDIAGVDLEASEVELVVERSTMTALRGEGFVVSRVRDIPALSPDRDFVAESYKAPADVEALVNDYMQRFPELAAKESIGKSNQNRDIWALRITKNVGVHDPSKPVVLYNGAHHAREVMSVEVPVDTIDTLLNGYGTDPKITHWVDANEIWVVPMVNVDGSNQVFTRDPMWRKNAKGCPASGVCASHTGVDINRNYPYGWASCNGSSSSTRADDYHGPSAASEPETNAMMNLVAKIRPVFDISYHAFSEVVLYPFGCRGQYVPSQAIVSDIAKKMAAKLPSDDSPSRNYRPGTPWELLYSADGGDIDWMYAQYQVVPYAIEINGMRQGFQPSFGQWRQKTVTKLRGAWQLLLDRLDGSAVRGVVPVAGAQVEVASTVAGGITQSRGVNPDGSFHVVTLPGTYKVTITAPGHAAFTQTVTVGDTRVNLDVSL
jgi:carboxypeptidase T